MAPVRVFHGFLVSFELTRASQWYGLKTLARLTFTPPEQRAPLAMDMLFPQAWLDERDPDDPQGRTNREVQIEVCINYPSLSL